MNNMKRTISLRNYVKDTYGIQRFDDIKMTILSNQQELLKKSISLHQSIRNSKCNLMKILYSEMKSI